MSVLAGSYRQTDTDRTRSNGNKRGALWHTKDALEIVPYQQRYYSPQKRALVTLFLCGWISNGGVCEQISHALAPGFSENGLHVLPLRVLNDHVAFRGGLFLQKFYLSQSLEDFSSNPLGLETNQPVGTL